MIDTKNVSEMQDFDWITLIGKPVMIGAYYKSDDKLIIQVTGNLGRVSITPDTFKFLMSDGVKEAFFNTDLAYGLVSYEVS